MNWDHYFLTIAKTVAAKSKDTTKVGCVIVGEDKQILSTGWNGLARGVEELPERLERPAKYQWTTHSESNAIANAARSGVRLKGATLYCTHHPCASCAGLMIQAGIQCVFFDGGGVLVGNHDTEIARQQFAEAQVKVYMIP